ncbi:hypothetical protein L915_12442, partial [Phytophthora nicotianae]
QLKRIDNFDAYCYIGRRDVRSTCYSYNNGQRDVRSTCYSYNNGQRDVRST